MSPLLSRAELLVAQRAGSVEAIAEFIAKHKSSAIAAEITGARRVAMVAAFERAREKGTLSALNEFATRYPDHQLEAALAQARRSLFARALIAYRKQASRDDPAANQFVERLLAYAEKSGLAKTKDACAVLACDPLPRLPPILRPRGYCDRSTEFHGTAPIQSCATLLSARRKYEKSATTRSSSLDASSRGADGFRGPLWEVPDGDSRT